MRSEYFLNYEQLRVFVQFLKSKGIEHEVIAHKQKCSVAKLPYYIYEIKFGGNN